MGFPNAKPIGSVVPFEGSLYRLVLPIDPKDFWNDKAYQVRTVDVHELPKARCGYHAFEIEDAVNLESHQHPKDFRFCYLAEQIQPNGKG